MLSRIQTSDLTETATTMIYADFNSIDEYPLGSNRFLLDLTGYGTLASLSAASLRLEEGQVMQFFDSDGLCVIGKIFFDPTMLSKNCSGWFAFFDKTDLRECVPIKHDFAIHLCFNCRANIKPYLDAVGRQYNECCPFCGAEVMTPLLPPRR